MTASPAPKVYVAGPEVFRPDAAAYAQIQRNLCERYGFVGLHPMDNNLDPGDRSMQTATRIYRADVDQIKACDLIVANCNAFRGVPMDDGTAYELGYANALGKPAYGYVRRLIPASEFAQTRCAFTRQPDGRLLDEDGYVLVDDFGTSVNLMMQCGMFEMGGRLVEGGFEACLQAVRRDLDNGRLRLS